MRWILDFRKHSSVTSKSTNRKWAHICLKKIFSYLVIPWGVPRPRHGNFSCPPKWCCRHIGFIERFKLFSQATKFAQSSLIGHRWSSGRASQNVINGWKPTKQEVRAYPISSLMLTNLVYGLRSPSWGCGKSHLTTGERMCWCVSLIKIYSYVRRYFGRSQR